MHDQSAMQRLKGRPVRTWDGEEIGVLDRVLVDPSDGLPLFGVIGVPGRLGLVKRLHPVPWLLFTQKPEAHEFILNLPKDCVEESPILKREEDGLDHSYRRKVYDYFDRAACVRPVESTDDDHPIPPVSPPTGTTLGG